MKVKIERKHFSFQWEYKYLFIRIGRWEYERMVA